MKYKFILLISIFIFIIYCFIPNVENFNFLKKIKKGTKKIGKSIKKDTKEVGKDLKKGTKIIGKDLKKGTKMVGKFIVKEGKSMINGIENFSEDVYKFGEKYIKTAIDDIKDSVEIGWSLFPIGGVIDAIYQEITTGHIDWQADFDPCYIISKDLKKVSKMIAPIINIVSKNLAKEIIKITQIKTLTVDKLQPSLNACLLSAFIINTGASAAAGVMTKACADGGSDDVECNFNCQNQIPKLICDLLPEGPCKDLRISSSMLYPSKNPKYFNICKFWSGNNECRGSNDIQNLISWIKCVIAPEACIISKTLGALCTMTESLASGDSLKQSLSNTGKNIGGVKSSSSGSKDKKYSSDNSQNNDRNSLSSNNSQDIEGQKYNKGAYYIKTFKDETIFQVTNNPKYNLSTNNKNLGNILYKNTNILVEEYNQYILWNITYNKDGTVYIQNNYTSSYIGYGNLTLNYDTVNDVFGKNFINPMEGIYPRNNVLYSNSEDLLDDSNKWEIEIQDNNGYLYVFPTIVSSSYYIKNTLSGFYLSLEKEINSDKLNVVCTKDPFEWTLIPQKYYQKNKYYGDEN
jgi:hypothetical protein